MKIPENVTITHTYIITYNHMLVFDPPLSTLPNLTELGLCGSCTYQE